MGADMSKVCSGSIGQDPDWEKGYEKAYRKDLDVKNSHHKFEAGMRQVINAVENGRAQGRLSLNSVKAFTAWLSFSDKHLQNLILKNGKNIWKDHKLFELVNLYLQLNDSTSNFYNELSICLEKLKDNQLLLEIALKCIEPAKSPLDSAQYSKCKEKLLEFKAAENPFNEKFSNLLKSVRELHEEIVEKVKGHKKKLDRKFKRVRAWQKICKVIYASAFATVVICSLLAAFMAAPPFALAVAAIPLIPIASTDDWINTRLTKCVNQMKVKREVVDTIWKVTNGGLWELNQISACVERLKGAIDSSVRSVDIYCGDEHNQTVNAMNCMFERQRNFKGQTASLADAVDDIRMKRQSFQDQIDDIRSKRQIFQDQIDDLRNHVDRCIGDIQENSLQVLQKNVRE